MNKSHTRILVDLFQLGQITAPPTTVAGGLLHKMWRLETDQGCYACKHLDWEIMKKPGVHERYQKSEELANRLFKAGIPAMTALNNDGKFVQRLGDDYYILFPWTDAKILPESQQTLEHSRKIGDILGRMHCTLATDKPSNSLQVSYDANEEFEFWIDRYIDGELMDFDTLIQWKDRLLEYNKPNKEILARLNQSCLYSHGDIHIRNILWINEADPIIIDWESAHPYHTSTELLAAAMNMAGIEYNRIELDHFDVFIDAYKEHFHVDPESASDAWWALYQAEMDWIIFNLKKSFRDDNTDAKIGQEQVSAMFKIMDVFDEKKSACIKIIEKHGS